LLSQCWDATEGEKTCGGKQTATDFHGRKLPLSALAKKARPFWRENDRIQRTAL
jgi:hypothetical protein